MIQNQPTSTDSAGPPQSDSQDPQMGGSPLDETISIVDSFIADPKAITPDSLNQLRMDLEDLKSMLDQEGTQTPAGPPAGGLAGIIGGGK